MTMIATGAAVPSAVAQRTSLPRKRPVDDFRNLIGVVHADSRELLDRAFRLRFQVYCVERRFEDATQFPDGRERDTDDLRSMHCLLTFRPTGMALGTVRLILPKPDVALPVSKMVGSRWRGLGLPIDTTAEISRFAIAKAVRRQVDGARPDRFMYTRDASQRSLPILSLGLIQAVAMMSLSRGITHVVAMMEPSLLRLLARLGVEFHAIGEPVNYHGLRQPGWAVMSDLIARFKACLPDLWDLAADCGL